MATMIWDEITTIKDLRKALRQGKNVDAVLKRIWDKGGAFGKDFHKVEMVANDDEFMIDIAHGVRRNWAFRKIKNFRFFIGR